MNVKHQPPSRYLTILKDNPRLCSGLGDPLPMLKEPVEEISFCVMGPALAAFTQWLLQRAMGNGIRRLFFLARDGYFFYQSAVEFCRKFGLPVECRYLSCSRYSLRIPFFHIDHSAALEFICRGGIDITPHKILSRAGLTSGEIDAVLKVLELPYGAEEILPYAKLAEIRQCLAECKLFWEYADAHSRQAYPKLAGYLKQEGMLDPSPVAIVDSGWTGSMQKILRDIRAQLGCVSPLTGYYWGLYEWPTGTRESEYCGYFFLPDNGLRNKVHFNNCVFEAVFTAPHGMTLGYEERGGRYEPIYGHMGEERQRFIREMEGYLNAYIRRFLSTTPVWGLSPYQEEEDKRTVGKLLRLFMDTPTSREADCFGSLTFSDDVVDRESHQLAEPLSEEEIRDNHVVHKLLVLSGRAKGYIRESAWLEGSIVRCGKRVKYHLAQNTLYKYIRYLWKHRKAGRMKREGET